MSAVKHAVCETCRKIVPAEHVAREGRVYLCKQCAGCGRTETLVSSDAQAWLRKRQLWGYDPAKARECLMDCRGCGHAHGPSIVFLNVTNRCNMKCPICIAGAPGTTYEFHPPLDYFERVFDALSKMQPRPAVHLSGGEPTVRDDLFEIIAMAKRKGLKVRVLTNGLKLAEEEFCRKLCNARVPVLLSFDGRDPEVYARLRGNRSVYLRKLAALNKLKRYSRRKNSIICCVAGGANDRHMRDLVELCHYHRDHIAELDLIPLTENGDGGRFEGDSTTTIEDVENILAASFPGEPVEFLPAGIGERLSRAGSFFGNFTFTLGEAHPNCESATLFLSDGGRYRPIGHYLKKPLHEIAEEVIRRAGAVEEKLARLNPNRFIQRWRGRLLVIRTFVPTLLRSVDFRRIAKGSPMVAAAKILAGLLVGMRLKDQARKHLAVTGSLGVVVLAFKGYACIDSERLQSCKTAYAFEDPDSGEVRVLPVCSYPLFRDEVERRIAVRFRAGVDGTAATARTACFQA